jgi:hypothetical protein
MLTTTIPTRELIWISIDPEGEQVTRYQSFVDEESMMRFIDDELDDNDAVEAYGYATIH